MTDIPLCPADGLPHHIVPVLVRSENDPTLFRQRVCVKCGLRDTFIQEGEPEEESQ